MRMKGLRVMAKKSPSLSTREFSEMTGISVSAVGRLIREGKIKGVKVSGKWLIDKYEINAKVVKALAKKPGEKKTSVSAGRTHLVQTARGESVNKKQPEPSGKTYSVAEFSKLTYLTEKGVEEYLKKGWLQGVRDERGNWHLGHENLQNPGMRHLVR